MTITQLKYFLAICEYGKIRITSENLHVSEPTISVSIKRLEEESGTPLFIRDRKQMILTEEGKQLRKRAEEVVESFDRLENEMHRPTGKFTVIRIGSPTTLGEYLCSRLISEFSEKNPSVLFELLPISSVGAVQQVADENIELAVCDQLAVTSDNLKFSPIICSPLYGCVRSDHPLAGEKNVTAQMLKNEKLIMLTEKAIITQEIIRWFHNEGVEPNLFMYSNRTSFTASMVKQHNAVAFLFGDLLEDSNPVNQLSFEGIKSFTLTPPLRFINGIVCKKRALLSKEAQRFYDFCSNYQFK